MPSRDHSTTHGDHADTPLGLRYLAKDGRDTQAVFLPAADDDEKIVVVAEPGRDADRMWRELRAFMDEEGIPYAQ